MGNPLLLDEFLVFIAAIILVVEIYSIRMLHVLRVRLGGIDGEYLLHVVARFGYLVTFAQFITLIYAIVRLMAYDTTNDARLILLAVIQSIIAIAFLWAVWEIGHLPVDSNVQNSSVKRTDPCKCPCEQIDDSISTTSAPVNQCDCHARITTT